MAERNISVVDEVKFRHEQKYICSTEDMEILNTALSAVAERDPNAGDTGWYHIRSIYFDDLFDSCLRENEDGVSSREKWRIRSYNCDKSRLSLECKRKEYGMIRKTSCLISQNEFEELLGGAICLGSGSSGPESFLHAHGIERHDTEGCGGV